MNGEVKFSENPSILVVDDELHLRQVLSEQLAFLGFRVTVAADGREALEKLKTSCVDIVLLDLRMPGMDGHTVLSAIKHSFPETEVIVFTGSTDVRDAVRAIKSGAFDFLCKPCDFQRLKMIISQAHEKILSRKARNECINKARSLGVEIVTVSKKLEEAVIAALKVASSELPVIIEGKSGTGKELFAHLIHLASERARKPFIAFNCAAVAPGLAERELFGHEKGAFTDAKEARPGIVELAGGGTLFLDEVCEMSPEIQAKFLRVLESGAYRRVGDPKERSTDIRIIAATNRDILAETEAGRFRADLFYRLRGFHLVLPPLSERPEDVEALAIYFLRGRKKLSTEALELLKSWSWPGNVRELKYVIEQAVLLSDSDFIDPEDLPSLLPLKEKNNSSSMKHQFKHFSLMDLEKEHILRVLQKNRNNRALTAKELGIHKTTLYRKLKQYGIRLPE